MFGKYVYFPWLALHLFLGRENADSAFQPLRWIPIWGEGSSLLLTTQETTKEMRQPTRVLGQAATQNKPTSAKQTCLEKANFKMREHIKKISQPCLLLRAYIPVYTMYQTVYTMYQCNGREVWRLLHFCLFLISSPAIFPSSFPLWVNYTLLIIQFIFHRDFSCTLGGAVWTD